MSLNNYHECVLPVLSKYFTSTKTIAERVDALNEYGVRVTLEDLERKGMVIHKSVIPTINGVKRLDKSHSRWRIA